MTYNELISSVKSFADRNDIEVSNQIDVFILLCEARINRVLKTREQSTRAYTPTVANEEYYPLPIDYRGMRTMHLNSSDPFTEPSVSKYSYVNPELFTEIRGTTNPCNVYTVQGNQLRIHPVQEAGKSIEMIYYQKVPNLNTTDNENWLSIEHPDIYISGMMAELESYVKNYDVAKEWDSKMGRAIAELSDSDVKEIWAGNPLTMRVG